MISKSQGQVLYLEMDLILLLSVYIVFNIDFVQEVKVLSDQDDFTFVWSPLKISKRCVNSYFVITF